MFCSLSRWITKYAHYSLLMIYNAATLLSLALYHITSESFSCVDFSFDFAFCCADRESICNLRASGDVIVGRRSDHNHRRLSHPIRVSHQRNRGCSRGFKRQRWDSSSGFRGRDHDDFRFPVWMRVELGWFRRWCCFYYRSFFRGRRLFLLWFGFLFGDGDQRFCGRRAADRFPCIQ